MARYVIAGAGMLMNEPPLSAHAERAHAMKNCLGVITLAVELLARAAPQTAHDRVVRIRKAAARLSQLLEAGLVDDAMATSRTASKRAICSVESITQPALNDVADRAEKANVHIVTRCEGGHLEGDQAALRECLLNLLVNAIDASPSGGLVFLRTRCTDDGDQVWTVRDRGQGMPFEQLQELGRPFSSRTRGGWGLGLALVQRTVDDHGGLLRVRSREGAGTTFSIWLPGNR